MRVSNHMIVPIECSFAAGPNVHNYMDNTQKVAHKNQNGRRFSVSSRNDTRKCVGSRVCAFV